ncbi:unnamed protein product [Paramecium pentaurelia]|uniref:Uncharacterized protein n=1 Tax=Paramecium pentaurelia TaxID=43138 RepID=A0A8S1XF35_9CILI|nr:unnamed protein product [Paramecium pentaurelia]
MRIQATSFRLPSLKLQPKDSYQCLSYGDNNLSSSSMIKYQSSPLRNYDPVPIKKRVRGMTIIIYNSHEKLKTADYCNGAELITQIQQNNQSTSVVNTFRRYRSKLKQLMQPSKDEGINSRDPRLHIFTDPGAPIRFDQFNKDRKDQQFQEKVRQLMGKVKLLFSSQQFYQEPLNQDIFHVTLVKLKDEYDCLYQDFNDYYVQSNKLDKHVLKLLNHMEIIQTLLKPKKPNKIIKYQPQKPNILQPEQQQSPSEIAQEIIEDTPQQSQTVQHPQFSNQQQDQQSSHEPREPSVFTPLTSKQYDIDQSISDLENDQQNKPNMQKKQKNKNNPQISQETILVEFSIQQNNSIVNQNQITYQVQTQPKIKQRQIPQSNSTQSIQQNDIYESTQILKEDTNSQIEKPTFKRTISNLGSTSKRRNTMLESKDGYQKQKKVNSISEQDDNNQEDEEEDEIQQMDSQIEQNDEQQQQSKINNLEFSFLDMLIGSQNIYNYPFYQDWEYHMIEIMKGTIFGEYDL